MEEIRKISKKEKVTLSDVIEKFLNAAIKELYTSKTLK